MKKSFIFFCILALSSISFSQEYSPGAIGQWKDYLPYKNAISVAEGSGKIYCATEGGLFSYNKTDNSIERMTKVTGLSDIKFSIVRYNTYNNILLVGYDNGSIDLIADNTIINIADIKNKPNLGNKNINNVHFVGHYAYLACGFGIVLLDMERREIKDTYKIGPDGSFINITDVATDGVNIYASTEAGIYKASLSDPNLISFTVWNKMTGIPNGTYNTMAYYNGHVYANFAKGTWLEDTVFAYDVSAGTWNKFLDGGNIIKDNIKQIRVVNNKMVISQEWHIYVYDNTLTRIMLIDDYGFTINRKPLEASIDISNTMWIADGENGLVKVVMNGNAQSIYPDGPGSSKVYSMQLKDNKLYVVPGGTSDNWANLHTRAEVYSFANGKWNNISGLQNGVNMDSLIDIITVAVDPLNPDHVFAGSFRGGVLEFNNNQLVQLYNTSNSTLATCPPRGYWMGISGLAFDQDNNLWVASSYVPTCLSVKRTNNTWASFDFTAFDISIASPVGSLLVTTSGQKWIVLPGNGILVYSDAGSFAPPNTSNTKRVGVGAGKGALPSNAVMCIAEDEDGEIWVGTDKGVTVFYSPESIFSGDNWDSQQILIEQDGHIQKLLETETVKAIAIDGANRKWIGTQNSGVFLISEDGTEEILHFTELNSPLLSNEINAINIDGSTGEVFIGTAKGIVSYRSTATEGLDEFANVYAFPNPVREGYEGTIAIKGLVKDASVKITDINGGLVYSTKALGGQAIWDGKNFNGEKARTGVYLVFCSNEDGTKTHVTKILFVN